MYEIKINPAAERYFKKLKDKKLKKAYADAIRELSLDPYIGQQKRGDLSGVFGYDVRYQGVNYEIAYRIVDVEGKQIIILLAGTRENFYKQLRRYF